MIKRFLSGLFAFVLSILIASSVWAEPVIVGQTSAPYALAYSTARHLFYFKGWWVAYHDGTNFVAAYSKDGKQFGVPQVASHVPAAVSCAAYLYQGRLIVLYSDTGYQSIYIREASLSSGKLSWSDPVVVGGKGNSFTAMAPTFSIDQQGMAWVVARSNIGDNHFNIWISGSLSTSRTQWSDRQYLSSQAEIAESGAGTSGLMVCAEPWHIVLVCDVAKLWEITRDVRWDWLYSLWNQPYSWKHSIVDPEFAGIHDISVIVEKDTLHMTYLQRGYNNSDTQMVYRRRSPDGKWGPSTTLGPSGTHTTALGRDGFGTLYAFYAKEHGPICVRTLPAGSSEWTPERIVWTVPHDEEAPYLWPAASDGDSKGVGLCWVQGKEGAYTVRFTTVS